MDVLIFSGQSNMQGQTEGLPACNETVDGAWEYRYLTDSLKPLNFPVGEDICDGKTVLLRESVNGGGSLVPACCRAYVKTSGKQAVAVHVAKGATTVAEWQPDTLRYQAMVRKIRAAKKKVGDVKRVWFIWLQGESDALIGTTETEYQRLFERMKNALKQDVGVEWFGIIKVGYFASQATWYQEGSMEERVQKDETIMRAQETIVSENDDCFMLTRICETLSREKRYINPFESGHYNNEAMDRIGQEAGNALATLQ